MTGDAPIAAEVRRADAEARARAQRAFEGALVLEAGAGTGKTTVLVGRVVAWALGPGWERAALALEEPDSDAIARRCLGRVAAITFTEAAAAEMEARVAQALSRLSAGSLPLGLEAAALPAEPERAARARSLLGAFDHLEVRTIHAFCRRLLTEYPLEAGLHPRFQVDARGATRRAVVREVLEDRLRHAALRDDSELMRLVERDVAPAELEAIAEAWLASGVGAEALASDPLTPERIRALATRVLEALWPMIDACGDRLDGLRGQAQVLATALRDSRELSQPNGAAEAALPETPADLETWLGALAAAWPKPAVDRLASYSRGKWTKGETAALADECDAVCAASAALLGPLRHALGLDVGMLAALHAALVPVVSAAESQLRAEGAVSFDALLRDTEALLTRRPDVAAVVRKRIDQLLVDEFQDTDRLQCEIVARIALAGPPSDRPGLFLVGDPKQSIYGWRSADLSAYEGFVDRVRSEADAELHRLAVNYRSVPEILVEVQRAIGPVMRPLPGVQPAFQPLLPAVDADAQLDADAHRRGDPAVEYWGAELWDAAGPLETTAGVATRLEARHLAQDVLRIHREQGVAWDEVGVLLRGTGDLDVYLDALRAVGIPYVVDRDRSYHSRHEVLVAQALARAVLDPNDQIALVAALRAAWVGVPDVAWRPLWRAGFPERVRGLLLEPAERGAALRDVCELVTGVADGLRGVPVPGLERVAGWERALRHALVVLAALRTSFETEPIHRFVEALRTWPLFEATEAARHLGGYRVANLDRFFRELQQSLDACDGDIAAVVRELRRDASRDPESSEGRAQHTTQDAVQVMTVHRAKGLDFGHVYLPQLHKVPGGSDTRALAVEMLDGLPEYRLRAAGRGFATLDFDRFQARQAAVADAERVRTLYVAMTRAKRRLVLGGLFRPDRRADASHASLLVEARAPALREARARAGESTDAASGGRACAVDLDGVRFVQIGLDRRVDDRAVDASIRPVASAATVRADRAALRAARAEARARDRRPLGASVTGLAHGAVDEGGRAEVEAASPGDAAATGAPGGERASHRVAADVAAQVGTAIHQVLERIDTSDRAEAEPWQPERAWLRDALAARVPARDRAAALARADDLVVRIATGPLGARLREIAPHVVARELAVLTGGEVASGDDAPVGFVAGAIDLVYRAPESGLLVIADFKTDRVDPQDAAAVAARVEAHRPQGVIYQRAVQLALGLEEPPRFELWLLDAGVVVPVDDPDAQAPAPRSETEREPGSEEPGSQLGLDLGPRGPD